MTKHQILIALCIGLLTGVGVGSVVFFDVRWVYVGIGIVVVGLVGALRSSFSDELQVISAKLGKGDFDDRPIRQSLMHNHSLLRPPLAPPLEEGGRSAKRALGKFISSLTPSNFASSFAKAMGDKKATSHKHVSLLTALLFLLGVGIGLLRITSTVQRPNEFQSWLGAKQDFEGVVVTEPDVRTDKQLITVQPTGHSQRVLVTTTLPTHIQYGDLVWVRGKIVEAQAFDDFDYPGYLARFNTYALVRYPKTIVLAHEKANPVISSLLQLKTALVRYLLSLYDNVRGNFLLGILIGAKRGLPPEVTENFIRTGTSHILAVSGFNISIFITWLAYAAYVVGRRMQIVFSAVCIVAFVIIAGPSSSVVRAACMGGVFMVGMLSGRLYYPVISLLFVAAGMVFLNPRILYWDIGFQLSAAATFGILLGVPFFEGAKERVRGFYKVFELLAITMCAIIFTLPISLWHFGELSLVAPLANMLLVPPVEIVMGLGFLSFIPWVGAGFAWINAYLLGWMLSLQQFLARPHWVTSELHITGAQVLLSYICLAMVYGGLHLLLQRKAKHAARNIKHEA